MKFRFWQCDVNLGVRGCLSRHCYDPSGAPSAFLLQPKRLFSNIMTGIYELSLLCG